jgi:hypothetical protein
MSKQVEAVQRVSNELITRIMMTSPELQPQTYKAAPGEELHPFSEIIAFGATVEYRLVVSTAASAQHFSVSWQRRVAYTNSYVTDLHTSFNLDNREVNLIFIAAGVAAYMPQRIY